MLTASWRTSPPRSFATSAGRFWITMMRVEGLFAHHHEGPCRRARRRNWRAAWRWPCRPRRRGRVATSPRDRAASRGRRHQHRRRRRAAAIEELAAVRAPHRLAPAVHRDLHLRRPSRRAGGRRPRSCPDWFETNASQRPSGETAGNSSSKRVATSGSTGPRPALRTMPMSARLPGARADAAVDDRAAVGSQMPV